MTLHLSLHVNTAQSTHGNASCAGSGGLRLKLSNLVFTVRQSLTEGRSSYNEK